MKQLIIIKRKDRKSILQTHKFFKFLINSQTGLKLTNFNWVDSTYFLVDLEYPRTRNMIKFAKQLDDFGFELLVPKAVI